MRSNTNKSFNQQKIALDRIARLLQQAEENFRDYPELSRRHVELARKIAMKYKVRFTDGQKRLFCKRCNAFLKTGVNSRTRIVKGKIVVTCLGCKNVKRMDYKS
jgi:ribonuclease P protein subunit RPR2